MSTQKATMRQLAAKIAPTLNIEPSEAEKRIKDLFNLTSRLLAQGESVEIDRLGIFTNIKGEISFKPDPALAQAINAPFAPFQPVALVDDVNPDTLDDPNPDTEFQPQAEAEPYEEPEVIVQLEPEEVEIKIDSEPVAKTTAEVDTEIILQQGIKPEPEPDLNQADETEASLQFPQDEEEYFIPPIQPAKKSGFPTWIWIIFSFLVGTAFGFGAYFYCTSLGWL